jgi:hypothetical protein
MQFISQILLNVLLFFIISHVFKLLKFSSIINEYTDYIGIKFIEMFIFFILLFHSWVHFSIFCQVFFEKGVRKLICEIYHCFFWPHRLINKLITSLYFFACHILRVYDIAIANILYIFHIMKLFVIIFAINTILFTFLIIRFIVFKNFINLILYDQFHILIIFIW